jgi:thiamine-phosphate pyrophosphorylase
MVTQRWPTAWLLTDERLGLDLDAAMIRAARAGAGILVRHHASSPEQRRSLAERVLALGATLAVARDVELARSLGAVFVHNPESPCADLPVSLSVHDEAEARQAAERGAALVFVSPVYPTRSHPGALALGEEQALALARQSDCHTIALGGVDRSRGPRLLQHGFDGWAGIDCWLRG